VTALCLDLLTWFQGIGRGVQLAVTIQLYVISARQLWLVGASADVKRHCRTNLASYAAWCGKGVVLRRVGPSGPQARREARPNVPPS
jgi:hypothetical protein